jgi:tetratricopeptide (TPR) repeat protein
MRLVEIQCRCCRAGWTRSLARVFVKTRGQSIGSADLVSGGGKNAERFQCPLYVKKRILASRVSRGTDNGGLSVAPHSLPPQPQSTCTRSGGILRCLFICYRANAASFTPDTNVKYEMNQIVCATGNPDSAEEIANPFSRSIVRPRHIPTRYWSARTHLLLKMTLTIVIAAAHLAARGQSAASVESIMTLIRSQSYEQALRETESVLKKSPRDFRLWTLQGLIRSYQSDYAGSLKSYQTALKIAPNYQAALKGEAELVYAHNLVESVPILEKIIKLDHSDSIAHEMLAIAKAKQGDCATAIVHFANAGKSLEQHSASLSAYGYCLAREKSPEAALPILERLVTVVPDASYAKFDLALVYFECRNYDAALKVLDPLLSENPGDAETFSLASEVYEAKGDTPHAVPLLRQAIVLDPLNPDNFVRFAGLCLDHDSTKAGIEMLDVGIMRIPNNPRLHVARGILYAQLANFDKAEADFKAAEILDSDASLVTYAADTLKIQKGAGSLSIESVRKQITSNPQSPQLRFVLAQLLTNDGANNTANSITEAKASAEAAIALKPDFVVARDLLANIYLMSGQYDLAATQSRTVLKYNPDSKSATYHLLIALRHQSVEANRTEIQALTKRLQELQTKEMRYEKERKLYRIATSNTVPR